MDEIVKYDLAEPFWNIVTATFGYTKPNQA